MFIKSFSSPRLGCCRFSAKLLWLTCRTSLPASVCSAHGNDAAMICVRPVLQSPNTAKNFVKPLERHRHSTTITCRYFITIATGFQQNIALKQGRCLTVAQTAAKRSIRTDLPFARQPKKKCGIFCGSGVGKGNKPTDCLLWYLRRGAFDAKCQKCFCVTLDKSNRTPATQPRTRKEAS